VSLYTNIVEKTFVGKDIGPVRDAEECSGESAVRGNPSPPLWYSFINFILNQCLSFFTSKLVT